MMLDLREQSLLKKNIIKNYIFDFNSEKTRCENYKFYQEISDIILFDGKGYEKSIGFDTVFGKRT